MYIPVKKSGKTKARISAYSPYAKGRTLSGFRFSYHSISSCYRGPGEPEYCSGQSVISYFKYIIRRGERSDTYLACLGNTHTLNITGFKNKRLRILCANKVCIICITVTCN